MVNFEVITPVIIIFTLIRFSKFFKLTSRTLAGIKFFTTKRFFNVPPPSSSSDPTSIENVLTRMGLTMMEVKDGAEEIGRIKNFAFFDVFEAMIQLLLVSFSIFIWSTIKSAIWPEEISTASGWTSAITIVLALVSIQSLLQIAYMTGGRAAETRIALVVACWSFIILLFVDIYPSSSTLSEAASHINALGAQISHRMEPVSISAVENLLHIFSAVFIALTCAAMTIPALRYTQTLHQLTMGRPYERTKDILMKLLLWLEFISPLFVVLTFNPWFASSTSDCAAQGHLSVQDNNMAVCSEKDERIATAKLYLQVGSLTWMVLLRTLSAKRHLQAFMDVSVATISQALMTTNTNELQVLRQTVENRSKYMLAAATQLLSVIGVFLALWVTFLRSLTHRFLSDFFLGLIYIIGQHQSLSSLLPSLRQQSSQVQYGATQWLLRNNSAILFEAMQNPATPSLETAVFATMGVISHEAQVAYDAVAKLEPESTQKPSLMGMYLQRFVNAHPMPAITAVASLQGIIFWVTTIWFAVNILSLAMWLFAPQWFTRTISESNGGGSAVAASTTVPKTANATATAAKTTPTDSKKKQ